MADISSRVVLKKLQRTTLIVIDLIIMLSVMFSPFLLSGLDDPQPLSTDEEDEEAARGRGRSFDKPASPKAESFLKHFGTLADTNILGSNNLKSTC